MLRLSDIEEKKKSFIQVFDCAHNNLYLYNLYNFTLYLYNF